MRHLYLLFFVLPLIVGADEKSIEYHENRRFWTSLNSDGTTHIALHILNESVNIVFPVEKPFAQIVSDMKLYSPTGNGECQDFTNTLNFTLLFDGQNHIRGKVIVETYNNERLVTMFLFQKCGRMENRHYYAIEMIKDIQQNLENDGRSCFRNGTHFHHYGTDTTKYTMGLNVTSNGFECQVFLILPPYMYVEDVPLINNGVVKLNNSFSGHDESFWWKTENDPMLFSAVSFDGDDNVVIDILKSNKTKPYFLRIGNFSSIPSFVFKSSLNCNDLKFGLYLNFHDGPECRIGINITLNGFKISTKNGEGKEIKDLSFSPTLVFDERKLYVKVKSIDNPSIYVFDVCPIPNLPSVAEDQLVIQIGPEGSVSGICDATNVSLIRKDIAKSIDVLIDQPLFIKPNATTKIMENGNVTIASDAAKKNEKDSKAGFEWWWILIGGVILLFILLPGLLISFICVRRNSRNEAKHGKRRHRIKHDQQQEDQPKLPDVKTAIPAESPKKKKNKKKNKKVDELDESSKISKRSSKKKYAKPKTKSKTIEREVDQYEPMPSEKDLPQREPFRDYSAIQTTQIDPTVETGSTQIASQKTVPETDEKAAAAKPRPKLKHRTKYDPTLQTQVTQSSTKER